MNYWFLALIIFCALSVGINLSKHGEKKDEKYNVWTASLAVIVQLAITYFAIKVGF